MSIRTRNYQNEFAAFEGTMMVAALIAIGLGIFFAYHPSYNSPRKNKEIEVQAFEQKDLKACDRIYGESYNFGPTDAQVPISQPVARKQCRDNIENDVRPVQFGG